MILPITYELFTPEIKEFLRKRSAEYLFSKQEPRFIIDVFKTKEGQVEVYLHKGGHFQSLSYEERKVG